MDSKWKSSFGRSRTPMGTVPISVIYGYKYPLSPIPNKTTSTPPYSRKSTAAWPSSLTNKYEYNNNSTVTSQPPQLVQARKFGTNVTNGVSNASYNTASEALTRTNTENTTTQMKTRGCLSYISNFRSKQTTEEAPKVTTSSSSSFNASSYSFRKPNLISSRSRTVDPNYSSHNNYSGLSSYRSASRAPTVGPTSYSTYSGYYSRSNVARSQDYRPSTTWYKPSRFTFSTISSSFTRFKTSFQTFKSRYF